MGFKISCFSLRWERSVCPYPLPPTLILLSHPEFPSFSSSGALRNKLFRMEGGGHRCDHLLHVPFFSWAFKKALHILKRRRKSQWPLVLLSTDTAGAGRGWRGVIFYRLATRRLLQWYTFFSPPFQRSPECRCANTGSGFTTANSLISKSGNILGQICFVKVENVPHHRWWP